MHPSIMADKLKSLRSCQASVMAPASKEAPSKVDARSWSSVEKIMTAIETLNTKMDTQTAALRQEIASIHQDLHTTVSSLDSRLTIFIVMCTKIT